MLPDVNQQLLHALHSAQPVEALVTVVHALKAAGKGQQEVYRIFDELLQSVTGPGSDQKDEAVREVMDRISGWCSDAQRLFETPLET